MIDKNVTNFGHLCVKDLLGRKTLTLKTFEELEDEYAIALPILYRNQLIVMAAKIQRRHPQTSAINHTLLTVLENVMESSKRSNHKLTSLQRTHNRNRIPERTAHLFFYCSTATNLYNQLKLHINSYLQECASEEPVTIDLDTALFHQTISGVHRISIIHLIMVAIPHPKYGPNTSKNTQSGTGTTDATSRTSTNEITDQFELKETRLSLQFVIKLY